MQTKTKSRSQKNDHLLITISDQQCTRHFKIPKYIKSIIISASVAICLVLVISNGLLYIQNGALNEARNETISMENAFVKLSAKNSSINKALALGKVKRTRISDVLAQMEQVSGVSANLNASLLERMNALSDYFSANELDLNGLSTDFVMIEESPSLESEAFQPRKDSADRSDNTLNDGSSTQASGGDKTHAAIEERVDMISLNISQQKMLHDSIPNGYPAENLGTRSAFGKRIHPTTNEASFHNGVDLKADEGTQIVATADGIVKQANYVAMNGNRIILTHNYGFETRYAHLSEMQVKPGDVVQKGDIIGLSGSTGRSDGAYLHYEVRYLDKAHDPGDFLAWEFGDQKIFTKVRGIQWQSLIGLINKQVSRPTLQLSQLALE